MPNNVGAGGFAAGRGPAGFAPILAPSVKLATTPPRATNYDPVTKTFTSTNGYYDSIHPVDQAVAIALLFPKGSLKSAPDVGHTFQQLGRNSGVRLVADAEDRARLALKKLVDAGSISIGNVDVDASIRGQVKIAVTYTNLVTGAVKKKTANVSIA